MSQRQMEITDGVRNEQSQHGTMAAVGQDVGVGGWMGWEEAEESCCDLKKTLTPVRAQVMGFYQLFIKPSCGVSSLITSDSWRMLHFLAYFEHCPLSLSPWAGLQLPSCTPNKCHSFIDTPSAEPHERSRPTSEPARTFQLLPQLSCLFQLLPGSCLFWMYLSAKRDLRAWRGGETWTESILFFQ